MPYLIREITQDDLFTINRWRNDPDINKHLCAPYRFINKDVDDLWYNSYLNTRSSNVRLSIIHKESNTLIGATYLTGIDWIARTAEFSIWIGDKSHQGNGAGKYASRMILKHAFHDLGLNRIYLTVLMENERARHLYKKIGFSEEGTLRQSVFKNGKFLNTILMSILASEFI